MRKQLKNARDQAGMTQQQVADKLHISLRQYQRMESGDSFGGVDLWDMLEDLFSIHQRILREISESHRGQEDNRQTHQKD